MAPPPPGMAELYKYISDYLDRPPQAGSSTSYRYNNSKENDKTEQTSRRPLISQCPSLSQAGIENPNLIPEIAFRIR